MSDTTLVVEQTCNDVSVVAGVFLARRGREVVPGYVEWAQRGEGRTGDHPKGAPTNAHLLCCRLSTYARYAFEATPRIWTLVDTLTRHYKSVRPLGLCRPCRACQRPRPGLWSTGGIHTPTTGMLWWRSSRPRTCSDPTQNVVPEATPSRASRLSHASRNAHDNHGRGPSMSNVNIRRAVDNIRANTTVYTPVVEERARQALFIASRVAAIVPVWEKKPWMKPS